MLNMIEKYCNKYGMEVSNKSVSTANVEMCTNEEKFKIQNITIKEYEREQAYEYLGFWTTADGNWEKHKEEADKAH
jgi:hypothetical protein